MSKVVSDYLTNVLSPQLRKFEVPEQYLQYLCEVVEKQMISALQLWNDEEYKNVFMLLVSEEAPFYQPDASTETKSFVVLTLRNSPFESLQSEAFLKTGLKKELSSSQVIKLTSSAVQFFKDYNLGTLEDRPIDLKDNIYFNLSNKYPIAWNALKALANSKDNICAYPRYTKVDEKNFSNDLFKKIIPSESFTISIIDGYSENIEQGLAQQIKNALDQHSCFYTDCFKMASRNPEVLLSILEILLANSVPFVTANYYLTNGHVERRKNILKAAHSIAEMKKHLSNVNGISQTHRKVLNDLNEHINRK